jgi:predicted ribosome quality control (RQC) complex YloA/Tae2 family protein
VPDQTLEEAAILAAYYSSAREDSKVPVDYTFRYQVKKPPGAKPGMVIYDHYWTLLADPGRQFLVEIIEH